MLELYSAPQSTCSQKVRLTLAEKNLNFVEHKMKLFQNDQLKPEYLKLNPNGVVPTLVDDGTPIINSSVIMEYLDEVHPEVALSPTEPRQRAHMRAWLRFFEEVPTVAVRFPSYNAAFARHFEKMSDEEFKALAKSKPLRDKFLGEMDKQKGFSVEKLKQAEDSISKTAKRMESPLSQSEYLLGKNLTLADSSSNSSPHFCKPLSPPTRHGKRTWSPLSTPCQVKLCSASSTRAAKKTNRTGDPGIRPRQEA